MPESILRENRLYYEEFNFVPLLNRTASGQSSAITLPPEARLMRLFLSVTAFGGTTPTLDVVLEEGWDLSNSTTNWMSLGAFPQKTGVSNDILSISNPFVKKVRFNWGIGGTAGPNFTFKVDAIARSAA